MGDEACVPLTLPNKTSHQIWQLPPNLQCKHNRFYLPPTPPLHKLTPKDQSRSLILPNSAKLPQKHLSALLLRNSTSIFFIDIVRKAH